jgi:hypothetical protein
MCRVPPECTMSDAFITALGHANSHIGRTE